MISPTTSLSQEQHEAIKHLLGDLQAKTRATSVFLANASGQLIQACGHMSETEIVPLAALVTSNIAATAEIARRLGEENQLDSLLHEGRECNIFISSVESRFVLTVVFAATIPIGLVRLFAKRTIEKLGEINWFLDADTLLADLGSEFGQDLDSTLDELLPSPRSTSAQQIIIR